MGIIEEENAALRLQINVLRDALQFLIATKELKESVGKTPEYEQMRIIAWGKATVAISSTPEQSLAEYRNKVIEDCAITIENCEPDEHGRLSIQEIAEAVSAMKEQP